MSNKQILVVEDERKIAAVVRDYLSQAGFSVTCIERGDLALPQVRKSPPALIILDIMLPGMDGTEVCREIRKFSRVPIIMLTAKVEEIDRLIGLELGADDYVCKPFSPRELTARVKAVLRRVYPQPVETRFEVGPIVLDAGTLQAWVNDEEIALTPSELNVLKALMSRPNRVFSRGELLTVAQGYDAEGYERTIDSHIKNLRKKIGAKLPDEEVISTVYGVGYRLNVLGKNE